MRLAARENPVVTPLKLTATQRHLGRLERLPGWYWWRVAERAGRVASAVR